MNVVWFDQKSEDESRTVRGREWFSDDETVEPEVIIHLPRGSDLAPELVPRATPMDPGTISADADTPDP